MSMLSTLCIMGKLDRQSLSDYQRTRVLIVLCKLDCFFQMKRKTVTLCSHVRGGDDTKQKSMTLHDIIPCRILKYHQVPIYFEWNSSLQECHPLKSSKCYWFFIQRAKGVTTWSNLCQMSDSIPLIWNEKLNITASLLVNLVEHLY